LGFFVVWDASAAGLYPIIQLLDTAELET
jgi:hypothetical protein